MAVVGVAGANTIDFDGSVYGQDGIEQSGEGAQGEGCQGGGAEMERGAVPGCESIGNIEEA